ncbi:MAG: chromosomal replication initiator DnaA [Verrucomicrobia bacterium RIFCSPHIGHO2_12_FULL_41_10]|nr:MAG: chromosomal replication initiator DnaA [Verrucomicrobia bacterium RIFCSPHIGHO2_12_FULL_41_10]HLB34744.1 chromosomal replication initiator protein DnaA [Chthoniobacterales bacterium]
MQFSNEQLWQQLSQIIRQRISADGYKRWFSDVHIMNSDVNSVTLSVPNPIHQFFIESNYSNLLNSSVEEIFKNPRTLHFVPRELQEQEKEDPSTGLRPAEQQSASSAKKSSATAGLNPSYTFESFIVGSNNQFAHAAAMAVAQAPARTYNPLFIYGDSGLGKTHLLQAVGHRILATKKGAKVVYLRSEQFTNEFIDAIQHGTLFQFRKRYRQADILMIDDIQFFAGKERSQEEFFHTFGALHDGHKQIILSSDRPPSEIDKLEKRLVSRFEWGMTAEVQPPDMETRIAILKGKAERLHIDVETWVLEFLAEHIRSDIRRLEGALMRVAAYKSLSGKPLSKDSIDHLLRDVLQEQARQKITIDHIQKQVAEHFDIRLADMSSKRRQSNIAYPRQVAMFLAREMTGSTLKEIGEAFGGKDHGTVLHACKLIKTRLSTDAQLRHVVRNLDKQLTQ